MKKYNSADYFMKKITAGFLALVMILSGVCILQPKCGRVQAAEDTTYAVKLDISQYQSEAPKPDDAEHQGWLFAGWYEEQECKTAITEKSTSSMEKWAKFVPADVLSIKCQINSDITKDSISNESVANLRIVSTVDSLRYNKVGFVIELKGGKLVHTTEKVYETINSSFDNLNVSYTPSQFDTKSKYFITATVTNIGYSLFTEGFRLTPFWETLDGTTVYGVGRYARIEDGYSGIINVPVRLYSDADVAAGYLTVSYDSDMFEYVSNTNGTYDVGTVFGEMKAVDTEGSGSVRRVRCIGISETITDSVGDVTADGMYINLRFKVKSNMTSGNVYNFAVSDENFSNKDENSVILDVLNASYKYIQ